MLGIELPYRDLERSTRFYTQVLGYEVVRPGGAEEGALLRHGSGYVSLEPSRALPDVDETAAVYLNHRVASLEPAAAAVEEHGGHVIDREPVPFVLGTLLSFRDPAGNYGHLVRLNAETEPDANLPQIFNMSVSAPGAAELESLFTEELGFEVLTRSYLPRTLPFVQRGGVSLVVHPSESSDDLTPGGSGAAILMGAPQEAMALLPAVNESKLLGTRVVMSGPGALEVVGVAPAAFAAALETPAD